MNSLDHKVRELFGDLAVDKRLSQLHEVARLPRFISEYLVSRFCRDDPQEGTKKVGQFVEAHYPELKDKDKILHDLMTKGEYKLIDEFKVETLIKEGTYKLIIPCLNIGNACIMPSILDEHENLLRSGMWGFANLRYMPELATDELSPIVMTRFNPFQASSINLSEFAGKRKEFTLEEWLDVLVNTIGLNSEAYSERAKLLMISRLIPLVEANTNLIELGPRATGKTYLYRNISYYTRIYAGGRVSPAILIYHVARRSLGDIGTKDCVVFDELARISFASPDEMMGKLKDYMVDGFVERGDKKIQAACSLVFMGNIEVEGEIPAEEFTNILPDFMKDSAFVDRLHGFIPGWELPKLRKAEEHLSKGYGLVTDYFCEVMHGLRKRDFTHIINEHVELAELIHNDVSFRDERGIKKVAAGMMKLLYPQGEINEKGIKFCLNLAIDYRQRVADWLHKLSPGEFKKKKLTYRIK
jgi:ATP-dependent Lon protease